MKTLTDFRKTLETGVDPRLRLVFNGICRTLLYNVVNAIYTRCDFVVAHDLFRVQT